MKKIKGVTGKIVKMLTALGLIVFLIVLMNISALNTINSKIDNAAVSTTGISDVASSIGNLVTMMDGISNASESNMENVDNLVSETKKFV